MLRHWLKHYKLKWNDMHRVSYKMLSLFVKEIPTDITKLETKINKYSIHKKSISCRHNEPHTSIWIETKFTQSQLKHYHCSSKRFLYTSRNWNQNSQRRTQSTVKQSDAGTLTETMLSDAQRNARTFSFKMLTLFVKEKPTDITKLETKIIRKTQSTANQFDARTLTKPLQAEARRNADTRLQNVIIIFQKNPTHITKLETKIIRKTRSAANHFDAGTLTQALQTEVERNAQTVSYKLLSMFVKQIPRDITKLQTKFIKDTIQQKINFMQHNEPRNWKRSETDITQSQLKHYHCSSKIFLYTSPNWNQKSQRMTQSTHEQSDAGTFTEALQTELERKAQTVGNNMLSLFVKEIPTDITKLETKIIRKTRSRANPFDAGTLTEALQTEVERNAKTVSNNMLTLFVKEIPPDITKLETKNIRKTRSTANQFDAETLTQALQTQVERNARTFSCKMLSLFVKEKPTGITKLETKIIRKTQSTANQFDAGTLTKPLQAEVRGNADTRLQNVIIIFQKESNGNHKTGNKNNQKDAIRSKSLWCWDIDSSTTNWSGTKCTDSQLQTVIIVCQTDS